MLKRFFTPKWQHKNPAVRQRAIASISDEETLIRIANTDSHTEVCETAIRQISSIGTLLKITPPHQLQATLNEQFSKLIEKEASQLAFHPSIASRLQRINNLELNKTVADHAKDVQLREAAIALIGEKEQTLLAHYILIDPSSKIRHLTAQRLCDEKIIRDTLKQLGQKDKRVAKALRSRLDILKTKQSQQKEVESIIELTEQVGHSDQCQRNQAHLNTLKNRWNQLANVGTENAHLFSSTCASAQNRIDDWQHKLDSLKPFVKAKESQCVLAESFLAQLSQRQRLSDLEAKELGETLDIFHQDWDQLELLPEQFEAPLANRFHQTLSHLHERIDFLKKNSRFTAGLEKIIHKAETQLQKPHLDTGLIETLTNDWEKQKQPEDPQLKEEYQKQFSRLIDQLRLLETKQKQNQEDALKKIRTWLCRIETSLEQDQLKDSDALQKEIKKELGRLANLPPQEKLTLEKRLQKVAPKIHELKGWRHWGTDQARKELTDEAVTLKDTDQDANTRATAVRELRSRWKKLGEIDPASGHKLWKNFDTACSEAYALSQAHFDAEEQQRQNNLVDRENICHDYEALEQSTNWDSPDWRDVDKQTRTLQNRWRNSAPVSRRHWTSILERYKSAEIAVESHLKNERRISQNKREDLIKKLEGLQNHDDLEEALQAARDAQRAWQPTVTGRRSDEQKLWKRFRAAADAIFARDKERQETERSEINTILDKKTSVCVAAEQLASADSISSGDITKLRSQWNEIEPVNNKQAKTLERRFEKALQSIKNNSQKGHWKQQLEQLSTIMERHDLLETLEKAIQKDGNDALIENCNQQWLDMGSNENTALDTRFEKASQGSLNEKELKKNAGSRASLLLDLEILLELKSPPELAEERMQKQVERLAGAMAAQKGDQSNLLEAALKRLMAYYESGAVPTENAEKFSSRLIPVVANLESRLTALIEG